VIARLKHVWKRLLGTLDDALPMPPDQRAERDWSGETFSQASDRRLLRIKLHGLEKRGRGTGR
jgi:hypothetical protein